MTQDGREDKVFPRTAISMWVSESTVRGLRLGTTEVNKKKSRAVECDLRDDSRTVHGSV